MAKIDELNQRYSQLCSQLGNTIYRIVVLENERNDILMKISEIEKQAKLLNEMENDEKPKSDQ
jgi:DNA repair exonuclease SbcCD ATPase subunit